MSVRAANDEGSMKQRRGGERCDHLGATVMYTTNKAVVRIKHVVRGKSAKFANLVYGDVKLLSAGK